jgi:DNA-binding MarR family transcriptional regulator
MDSSNRRENAHHAPAPQAQPRTVDGAAAIASLQALGDAVHDADDQALRTLRMLPIDALALRHLVMAQREGQTVNGTQLAQVLRLSSAGTTKLIDRLVRSGRAERHPNPNDRRGIIIVPADTAAQDLARAYGHIQNPLIAAIDELNPDEADTIQRFASRLTAALREDLTGPSATAPTP